MALDLPVKYKATVNESQFNNTDAKTKKDYTSDSTSCIHDLENVRHATFDETKLY
jgi:hypothetical protein